MRRVKLFLCFAVLTRLFFTKAYCSQDLNGLNYFLEEYRDGVKTGNRLLINLVVIPNGKSSEPKWYLNYLWFRNEDSKNDVIVSGPKHSRTNDDYGRPRLKNIKWVPDKSIEADFKEGVDTFKLTAVKVGENYNDWKVEGNGVSHFYAGGKPKKWHFEGVKEIKLENEMLRLGDNSQ